MNDQEYDDLLRSMSIDSPNYDFGDIDLGSQDFGSNFDLGSFEDLAAVDMGNLADMDFGNLNLGNLNLGDIDLGNIDLGGGGIDALLGGAGADDLFRDEQGLDDLMMSLSGDGMKFDGVGQPDNPLYSDTSEEVQPWQNLEGSGTTQLSDAYSYEDGKWSIRGNYDEETGRFVPDPNGTFVANEENNFDPLAKSGTNKESMDGYTYDKKTGTWTTPRGETYTPKVAPTHTPKSGAQVMVNAGALPSGYAGLPADKGSTAGGSGGGSGGGGTKPGGGVGGGGGTTKDNGLGALLPLLLMMMMMNRDKGGGGSGATIPALTASQKQTPYMQQQRAPGYRPGQGGISYFEPTQFTPKMAAGGGIGGLLNGPGDGVSDSIPAVIDGNMAGGGQPAQVARGEYIMDARTVAALGNGSTDAGAERLDKMRKNILRDDKKTGVGEDSKAYRHLMA